MKAMPPQLADFKLIVSKIRLYALIGASLVLSSGMLSPTHATPVRVGDLAPLDWTATAHAATRGEGGWRIEHTFSLPGSAFLKAHFAELQLRAGESLILKDKSGHVVETIDSRRTPSLGGFWSLSVPGDQLRLELILRRDPALHPPTVQIDGIVVGDPVALAEVTDSQPRKSLCGSPDFEDAACYSGDAAKWSNILATSGVLTVNSGGAFWCTGINVSPRNMVLTAESCLPDTAACQNAEFVFGFYRDGCGDQAPIADGWQSYRCVETVASSPFANVCEPTPANLDFSLHRVDGNAAGEWAWADPDATPVVSGERLYIPQHANGRPLEITHGEGADVEVDGMTLRYFGTLDTESSSVGAPLFRDSDDRLVGLHHCGGCASPGLGNRGVRMQDIRPLIEDFLCESTLVIEPASTDELTPLDGNGDSVLDPGETWQITPQLRNAACTTATTNVTATFSLAAGSAPAELLDSTSTLGNLAAATTAATSPIRFRVDPAAACSGAVVLDLVSITSDGGSFTGLSNYFNQDLGEIPEQTVLTEPFNSGLPPGWEVIDGGSTLGADATWSTDDPGDRQLPGPPFAIADSEFQGPGELMDEQLITPILDVTGSSRVTFRFRHEFSWFEGNMNEQGNVDVRSSMTGGAWTKLVSFQGADAAGEVALDLAPFASQDLQIRFHYFQAEWEGWWAVDDVRVTTDNGQVCFSGLFVDGFESGTTAAWSATSPPIP